MMSVSSIHKWAVTRRTSCSNQLEQEKNYQWSSSDDYASRDTENFAKLTIDNIAKYVEWAIKKLGAT